MRIELKLNLKVSEYILAHIGPRELGGHPLGGCGSGFGLVPGYTTLSVRVRTNTQFGALKIKRVRTKWSGYRLPHWEATKGRAS